jgi:hypothetical protein
MPYAAFVLILVFVACDENNAAGPVDAGVSDDAGQSECGVAETGIWSVRDAGLEGEAASALRETNLFGAWGAVEQDDQDERRITVWAAGSAGRVLRLQGDEWSLLQTPTQEQLTSVWGTSNSNVWVAGYGGVVLQYDGTQWLDRSPPYQRFAALDAGVVGPDAAVAKRRNLWGVWVAGSDDQTDAVFVVGDEGTVLVWQAEEWSRVATGDVQENLSGVWGANPSNVFAVGEFGTVIKGNSTSFERQQTGIARGLKGVWGRRANEVYAVGIEGTVLRYDGSSWSQIDGAPRQVLQDIWGPANDRSVTYIVGIDGALIRMSGGPAFRRGATFDVIGCVTANRLSGIWGTLVEADAAMPSGDPDGGVPDAGTVQLPAVWVVGVSGTVITGP